MQRPIYLDCHATTPVDERVLQAMLPYFRECFGNAASMGHLYGWEAEAAVKLAREAIANSINAIPEEIIFTSGATEANNLAIKGVAEAYHQQGRHLITVKTEHSAVLDPCAYLRSLGFEITYLSVKSDGLIDLQELEQAIRADTILVSVMAANNEIGVIQPIAEIAKICGDRTPQKIIFHTDAAQAIGKIPIDVKAMQIDLMSLTAHKIYGAKGIGALYVRRRPSINVAPQLHGGGHERGMRSGTLYTPQIVGFAKALEIAIADQMEEQQKALHLREYLWQRLSELNQPRDRNICGQNIRVILNGHPTQRLAGNLNVSFAGVNGSSLMLALRSIVAVSSGSACTAKNAPSHVLTALGHPPELAHASIRFGIGRFNTLAEIETVANHIIDSVRSLSN
jgi:cysteine desulfurase